MLSAGDKVFGVDSWLPSSGNIEFSIGSSSEKVADMRV
jgi:hypothetical protein